jgi:hypothetical protein
MNTLFSALGAMMLLTICGSSALAQNQQTFVSGAGLDTNLCTLTSPCRTFTRALSQTNAAGVVTVLDSAGYGAFTINKAISIVCAPGAYAGISVFSGNGIDIAAGASDTVILRGLTVNNQGSSGNGISYQTAGLVHVESCVVNGFSSADGVLANTGNSCVLEIKDSIFRGNEGGIVVSGPIAATVDHVRAEANFTGLEASSGAKVTVRNSLFSLNENGLSAFSNSNLAAELNVENCVVANNSSDGIEAVCDSTGVSTARVSNSTVVNNGVGLFNAGSPAVLLSRGNNTIEGNTTNTSGAIGAYTAD